VHVATTRTSPNGEPEGGWIPNEKIPLADALRAYTWQAAPGPRSTSSGSAR
jgi:hypothetical protein